jgi:hypothetical protein
MTYSATPIDIFVCFYDRSNKDWRSKLIKYLAKAKYQHCGLMVHKNGVSTVFATSLRSTGRFTNATSYHRRERPTEIISLGNHSASFGQLFNFSSDLFKEDLRSIIWWWFVGRFILSKMLPPTCTLITCQFLRICGILVGNHVNPQNLYRELTNAANNYSWTSWSWEDYISKYHSD